MVEIIEINDLAQNRRDIVSQERSLILKKIAILRAEKDSTNQLKLQTKRLARLDREYLKHESQRHKLRTHQSNSLANGIREQARREIEWATNQHVNLFDKKYDAYGEV